MDRLDAARVFVTIVEQGSLSGAARSLDMSRAMVTRYLAHLESWVGTRLLHRTTRRIGLTGAGDATLARCRALLELADELPQAQAGAADDEALQGMLRVSGPRVLSGRMMARACADFQRLHPRVRIDLQISDATVNLVEERIDLALRITTQPAPGLIARPLGVCASVLCAAPAYLASRGVPHELADLSMHNCLTYQYFAHSLWHFSHAGEAMSVAVDGNLSSNDADTLLAATLAGAGISLQPRFSTAPLVASGKLVALLPQYQPRVMTVYAAYASRRNMAPALRSLLDYLPGWLAADPFWQQAA